jgi:fatty acid desaturase
MRAVCAPTPHEHIHEHLDVYEQREEMARRLPRLVQPFLTWLTALPAISERSSERKPGHVVAEAFAWILIGTALSATAAAKGRGFLLLLPVGLLATSSGMGLLQAVVFHHCSHGMVFASRQANRAVGKLISLLLLIKEFDVYQKEHAAHHSPKRLLTADDEHLSFLTRFLGVYPGMTRQEMRRRMLRSFVSPAFHARLMTARLSGCLFRCSAIEGVTRALAWGVILGLSWWTGLIVPVLIAWFVPAILLLQIATTLRVLAEHRAPRADAAPRRDRGFIAHSTAGVFPGAPVPPVAATKGRALLAWTIWWGEMLTVHLFSRLFVLVGDAPAHDYHHRRPGSRDWPNFIHARAQDRALGCPGFPANYFSTLGLFRAIDENLSSLAEVRPSVAARLEPIDGAEVGVPA